LDFNQPISTLRVVLLLRNEPNQEITYSDCVKCLFLLIKKIWDGDFPDEWNSASIVSIPKKSDFSD